MSRLDSWHRKISTGHHFQNGHHNTAKIQHCPISTKFDMWVDNDAPNWFPTLKNFYLSPFSKWPPQSFSHFWDRPVPIFTDVRFSYVALVQDKKVTCVLPANACCTVGCQLPPNSPCFSFLKLFLNSFMYYILLANVHLSQCLILFSGSLPVNVCLLWVNNKVLSLVSN
jgi:hypothetical protein